MLLKELQVMYNRDIEIQKLKKKVRELEISIIIITIAYPIMIWILAYFVSK